MFDWMTLRITQLPNIATRAIPALLVSTSYLAFLTNQGSSILQIHHFLLCASLFALLYLIGRQLDKAFPPGLWAFSAIVITLFLDSAIGLGTLSLPVLKLLSPSGPGWATMQISFFVLVTALIFTILRKMGKTAVNLLSVFVSVLFLSTLVTSVIAGMSADSSEPYKFGSRDEPTSRHTPAAEASSTASLVIHIIFDAHGSLLPLAEDSPEARTIKTEARRVLVDHGFDVYLNAYSKYFQTHDSIPALLNFAEPQEHKKFFGYGSNENSVVEIEAFRLFSSQGYSISVYQSTWFDFCRARDVRYSMCRSYYALGALLPHIDRSDDWRTRHVVPLRMFATSFPSLSQGITYYQRFVRPRIFRSFNIKLPKWETPQNSYVFSSMQMLRDLSRDAQTNRGARYYFAHLLTPHDPFSVKADCSVREPYGFWPNAVDEDALVNGQENSVESRKRALAAYYQQVGCVYKQLDELLHEWRKTGLLKQAKVIIHGDHGSRISLNWPHSADSSAVSIANDFDNYATVYAVHNPGQSVGREIGLVRSVQGLYRETITGERAGDQGPLVVHVRDSIVSNKGQKLGTRPFRGFAVQVTEAAR